METFASGKTIKNTNYKFLRQYKGASGIKTGYTNAAGHNLAASAKRGDKQLIGIVIGTSSSSERVKKIMGLFDKAFKIIPTKKNISKLAPLNLAKNTTSKRVVTVAVPMLKPKSFDLMLESERKGEINYTKKRTKKAAIDSMEMEHVNVQIGTYTNVVSAEKDMPNILLLNIDLLTGVDNASIK